jgi:hypothetical protein
LLGGCRVIEIINSIFTKNKTMLTKENVKKTIDKLPNSFSIDQLIDELLFVEKVNIGMLQSEQNQILTTRQAKLKLKKWLK